MGEIMIQLRKWAKGREKLANDEEPEAIKLEKDVPKLTKEVENSFI